MIIQPSRVLPILLAFLLAACTGSGGSDTPAQANADPLTTPSGEQSTGGDVGTVTAVAKLSLAEDSLNRSVIATLPDGSKIDLFFPEGSVRESVDVRVLPLPKVTLPTGTVAAGVRLEPDGSVLFNSATLTLKVPGTLDKRTTSGFAIHRGVVTYHPVVLRYENDNSGQPFTLADISLSGFSDHGLVTGVDPAIIAQAIQINAPAIDRLNAKLLDLSMRDLPATDEIRAELADFFVTQVKPKLVDTADLTTQLSLEVAMRTYIHWRDEQAVMAQRFDGLDIAGVVDPVEVEALLKTAIAENIKHWNEECVNNLEPEDAKRAVHAWLWVRAVHMENVSGLRKSDLLSMLCMQMAILGQDLDAVLEPDQTKPLKVKAVLKIKNDTQHRVKPRSRVRVKSVQGGKVKAPRTRQKMMARGDEGADDDSVALTDDAGLATFNVTLEGDDPGLAAVLTVSPEGFGGVLSEEIRVFRPRKGAQNKLIAGRTFAGTVKEYYIYNYYNGYCSSAPTTGPCAGQSECLVGGSQRHLGGTITIAGDPFGYVVDFADFGFEPPAGAPPITTTWRHMGTGTFSAVEYGPGFSVTRDGTTTLASESIYQHIAARNIGLSVRSDTGNLIGRIDWQCHRQELEMQPLATPNS